LVAKSLEREQAKEARKTATKRRKNKKAPDVETDSDSEESVALITRKVRRLTTSVIPRKKLVASILIPRKMIPVPRKTIPFPRKTILKATVDVPSSSDEDDKKPAARQVLFATIPKKKKASPTAMQVEQTFIEKVHQMEEEDRASSKDELTPSPSSDEEEMEFD
jgi:hypothetical protein